MDNLIKIAVKDGKVSIDFKTNISLPDFLALVSTAALSAMRQTVASLPEAERQKATEEIYDMYNAAASNTLAYFAPEIEMRPNLTTQAILEAENALLTRQEGPHV